MGAIFQIVRTKSADNSIRSRTVVNIILISILACFSFSPLLDRNIEDVYKVGLFLLCLVTSYGLRNNGNTTYRPFYIFWLFLLGWQLLLVIVGHSKCSPNLIIARIPTYMIPLLMCNVLESYNKNELILLLNLMLWILGINIIDNVRIGIQNPLIFQTLNLVGTADSDYHSNAGSTSFVSTCLFLTPSLLMLLKSSLNINRVIVMGVFILASFFAVIINARGIGFFIFLFLIIGTFFSEKIHRSNHSRLYYIVTSLLLGTIIVLIAVPALNFFMELFASFDGMAGRMTERLEDVLSLIQGRGNMENVNQNGSFYMRYMLWLTSISTFTGSLSNFLIGVGEFSHQHDYYSLIASGVGGHSEILDILAKYGIVGGVLMFVSIKRSIRYIKNTCTTDIMKNNIIIFFFAYIFYCFVSKSFTQDLSLVVFVIFPIVIKLISLQYQKA